MILRDVSSVLFWSCYSWESCLGWWGRLFQAIGPATERQTTEVHIPIQSKPSRVSIIISVVIICNSVPMLARHQQNAQCASKVSIHRDTVLEILLHRNYSLTDWLHRLTEFLSVFLLITVFFTSFSFIFIFGYVWHMMMIPDSILCIQWKFIFSNYKKGRVLCKKTSRLSLCKSFCFYQHQLSFLLSKKVDVW